MLLWVMVICFVNLSIKFCIDYFRYIDKRTGNSAEVGFPVLFLCPFVWEKEKRKILRRILTNGWSKSSVLPVFSRWMLLLDVVFKANNLKYNNISLKIASQNRIFLRKRPFTREFAKELPFEQERGCHSLLPLSRPKGGRI